MRVVNDRRRLPRVAWSGQAVIQTRRGELRGVGLDLSADGMAVLTSVGGRAKELVRVHAQLGDFPLLTDARVVRMSKRRDGFRWALRFERMDQRMQANLEAFVRHHLANAARIRQAQLYAGRLKGGAMPPPPVERPHGGHLPTAGPAHLADPSVPLVDPDSPHPYEPNQLDLSGPVLSGSTAPGVLEIDLPDLPDMEIHSVGYAPEVSSAAPPQEPAAYVPYQATDVDEEAELLGEGPMTPAPIEESLAVPTLETPPRRTDLPERAQTLTPGVIEIDDEEELSLEDILSEVDAQEPPASDLQLPPPRGPDPHASGLGDVVVLDQDLGDDEDTRRRDSTVTPLPAEPEPAPAPTIRDADAPEGAVDEARPAGTPAPDIAGLPFDGGAEGGHEQLSFDDSASVGPSPVLTPLPEDEGFAASGIPSLDAALVWTTRTPPPAPASTPAVGPTFPAHPSPFYEQADAADDRADGAASSSVPTPFDEDEDEDADADADEVDPGADPRSPALLEEDAEPDSSAPSLYPDDVAPFDPYAPNPESPPLDAQPRPQPGSAPRSLGELPPVVAGLYTPSSNAPLDDDPSGAYQTPSFEPFTSVEEGLYAASGATFEEQQGNPRQRLASLQSDDNSPHALADQHDLFLGDIEGVTTGFSPAGVAQKAESEIPRAEPESDLESALAANATTTVHGAPEVVEAEPTRPVDTGPAEFTPAPRDPADEDAHATPGPFSLDASEPALRQRRLPTFPDFNVVPDFDQPLDDGDSYASGVFSAQSGKTVVAAFEDLGLTPPPDDGPSTPASPPRDFAPVPRFGGTQAPSAGFTVVAPIDEWMDESAGGGGTIVATAEDVEAWRMAAHVPQRAKMLDDARTSAYTPPPESLPPAESPSLGTGIHEDALTAMRVGRGGPSGGGGAGFELNPRGPAPSGASTVARVKLAKKQVPRPGATIPAPPEAAGGTSPAPSTRPTLPPSTRTPGRAATPGRSPRRDTSLRTSGRPPSPPSDRPNDPPVRDRESLGAPPSPPPSKRSLVEDALAQLKQKTDEKRKQGSGTPCAADEKPAPVVTKKRPKRRRRAETTDPALAELYKAAMTDLERSQNDA